MEEIVGNIENYLYELEKMKPKLQEIFSSSEIGQEQLSKMERLIQSTKIYLSSEGIKLEKLQDIETKLDTLRSTYASLVSKSDED